MAIPALLGRSASAAWQPTKIKPIPGSWISIIWSDRRHYYWNATCAKFSREQWEESVKEVAGLGMQYLVLLATVIDRRAYFDTPLVPKAKELACAEPIEAMLSAADQCGVRFFISTGFYGNWLHVRMAIASDRRIGPSFLFPGVGYGGSCFPKDVKALLKFSHESRYAFRILEAVEAANEDQKGKLVGKAEAHFGSLKGRQFAVWGLAFKPKTDDMREAPAITIISWLLARGAKLHAFDPEAMHTSRVIFGNRIVYASGAYEALTGVDALFVVKEWNEFRRPDFAKMKRLMKAPVIFDGRNIYNPVAMRELGFSYYSIGRR